MRTRKPKRAKGKKTAVMAGTHVLALRSFVASECAEYERSGGKNLCLTKRGGPSGYCVFFENGLKRCGYLERAVLPADPVMEAEYYTVRGGFPPGVKYTVCDFCGRRFTYRGSTDDVCPDCQRKRKKQTENKPEAVDGRDFKTTAWELYASTAALYTEDPALAGKAGKVFRQMAVYEKKGAAFAWQFVGKRAELEAFLKSEGIEAEWLPDVPESGADDAIDPKKVFCSLCGEPLTGIAVGRVKYCDSCRAVKRKRKAS